PVQHHHAHIVSCMADNNGLSEPVIGVAFDGTGYGEDGAVWGGEFILADYSDYRRVAHFEYVPLPGGDAAILKPYRMALSYLFKIFGSDVLNMGLPFLRRIDQDEIAIIGMQIKGGLNILQTSSCGRLFDAVSALLDVCGETDYEGQAAVELESVAQIITGERYPYNIFDKDGIRVISFDGMIRAIINDIRNGAGISFISAKFHATIADVILNVCRQLVKENNINKVALSGGVFQNRLLLELAVRRLEENGMIVLMHKDVPANDGGIALGQAVIAQSKMHKAQDAMRNEI
ncbi:MAG: carbamoyltransferase HypF, partial [Deltaproteobacteria bacterium]|nr:carbamoyltransferase HypF [Deltaproteobacteria bacterium]